MRDLANIQDDRIRLQFDLDRLEDWAKKGKLFYNMDNICITIFKEEKHRDHRQDREFIAEKQQEKTLSIFDKVNMSQHCGLLWKDRQSSELHQKKLYSKDI